MLYIKEFFSNPPSLTTYAVAITLAALCGWYGTGYMLQNAPKDISPIAGGR
jgi:hypothetical protein